MSILNCMRKHRVLALYRAERCLAHRRTLAKRKTFLMPVVPTALKAASVSTSATMPTANSASITNAATVAMVGKEEFTPIDVSSLKEDGGFSSSFRNLMNSLFTMLSPDSKSEPLDDFDDLSLKPAAQVSDVVQSKSREVFWRCDLDSYAANKKNEDRSQYVIDVIPKTEEEDRDHPLFFCAAYDGHGGEEAVEFVQIRLYENIKKHLMEDPLSQGKTSHVPDAIRQGFLETDQEFNRHSVSMFRKGVWSSCSVGACAVVALIMDKRLYVASCGDCRAIIAFREQDGSLSVKQITHDHSANEQEEQERLKRLYPEDFDIVREIGTKNYYVKGRLQPTRSIGDTYMKCKEVNRSPMPRSLRVRGDFKKPYITAVPDVFELDLTEDNQSHAEFLVLGSDGLYGELENEEIARLVERFRAQGIENVSAALRNTILERIAVNYGFGSVSEVEGLLPGERRSYHDDITIDVVHFASPDEDWKEHSPSNDNGHEVNNENNEGDSGEELICAEAR